MKQVLFVLALLAVALPASAQTVANPIAVEFTPSADHNVNAPVTGTPLVAGYRMKVYTPAACTTTACTGDPVFTLEFNKPTPAAGVIRMNNIYGGLVLNTVYQGTVEAYGPGGAMASTPTVPFGNETIAAPRAPANPVNISPLPSSRPIRKLPATPLER